MIMRKAAELGELHFGEIVDWIVRESGSTKIKAAFEARVSIKACLLYTSDAADE